jgi:Tfp pilus assembly protein PilF
MLLTACATKPAPVQRTLKAPAGSVSAAAAAVEEGNRLFAAGQWDDAKAQYESALKTQPSLAEAHYNLALTFEKKGDKATARQHYIEAANLAPGHKVIWDAPPLRRHGEEIERKPKPGSMMEPSGSKPQF